MHQININKLSKETCLTLSGMTNEGGKERRLALVLDQKLLTADRTDKHFSLSLKTIKQCAQIYKPN